MTHVTSKADVGHPIMRSLKELYLSIFVLFYRLSGWDGRMKASTASICVSVVEGVLALTIWSWMQIAIHQYIELNHWLVMIFFFLIAGPGDYFLVVRGHGIAFEKQFYSFSKRKRIALYVSAIGIVVMTGIAFYLSVADYHLTFNLPRR